jgi:phenylacetate-CoA ligase
MMNHPRSRTPGTIWPAIPEKNGAALLALLFQMETGQWLPAAEIEHRQLRQLQVLLTYCAQNVPFYRDRLAGLHGALNGAFNWEAWRSLPLLERNHLIDHQQQLLSATIPPGHGQTRKHVTSGSTGHPVTVYGSEVTGFFWKAFTLREMIWHLRNFMGKIAIIR